MDEMNVKRAAGCYDCEIVRTLNFERVCLQKIPEFTSFSALCKLYLPRNEIRKIHGLNVLCGRSNSFAR